MEEKSELDTLTTKFNNLCDETVEIQTVPNTSSSSTKVSSITNYKKIGFMVLGVFIFSTILTYFFIDPKLYKENDKVSKKQFLFISLCVTLFLFIYYYGFRYILNKYF